jgi:hypothetical protein
MGQAGIEKTPELPRGGYNLNANRAIVTAATLYAFRCLINEDIPLNAGVLAPVKIVLPECLLNPPEQDNPEKCAAIVGGERRNLAARRGCAAGRARCRRGQSGNDEQPDLWRRHVRLL